MAQAADHRGPAQAQVLHGTMAELFGALDKGDRQGVERLKRTNAADMTANKLNTFKRGPYDRTALHEAAARSCTGIVRFLIKECQADPNPRDNQQRTPLHLAAEQGHDFCCEVLLGLGADPEPLDEANLTPVQLAAYNGHDRTAMVLSSNLPGYNVKSASKT